MKLCVSCGNPAAEGYGYICHACIKELGVTTNVWTSGGTYDERA